MARPAARPAWPAASRLTAPQPSACLLLREELVLLLAQLVHCRLRLCDLSWLFWTVRGSLPKAPAQASDGPETGAGRPWFWLLW